MKDKRICQNSLPLAVPRAASFASFRSQVKLLYPLATLHNKSLWSLVALNNNHFSRLRAMTGERQFC